MNARLVSVAVAAAIVATPAAAAAQSAECANVPCAAGSAGPAIEEIWAHAGRAHELKLAFVDALRAFTRAQAGRVGDDGAALRASLDAMRQALGRWDRAIGTLETAVAGIRRTADVHVALATVYLDRHRPDEALRELADAERLARTRADVSTLRAHAYILLARPADAARALQDAARIDPRPTVVYWQAHQWRLAARADDPGAPASAIAGAAREPPRARAADPAAIGEAERRAAAAFRQFVDLVAAAPDRVIAAREPFERVDLLRQAGGTAPVFPVTPYAGGYAALERGEYREALSLFARGMERDPMTRAPARVQKAGAAAAAALRRGDAPGALAVLRALVGELPEEAEAQRLLALVYAVDERYAESITHFEAAIRLDPLVERARLGLAASLTAAGRVADAEQHLRAAADRFPDAAAVRYELGRVYESQARYTEAVAAFEASRARRAIVGRDHLRQTLGRHYVNQSEFDRAVAAYVDRIDVNPNDAEAHRQLAEVYFLQGRDDEALAEFVAAAFLDAADARAYVGVGQVFARRGDHPRAVAALAHAVERGAVDAQTRYLLGQALVRVGRVEEGRAQIAISQQLQADALAAGRDEFERRALRRAAETALAAGNHADAVAAFERLTAAHAIEWTEQVHRSLAAAYEALGRREDAAHHQERAEQLGTGRRLQRLRDLVGTP